MSHRCTYCDDGYCIKEYGETCPYDSIDEQYKCLEYEPKENYIAAFTNEALKELQNEAVRDFATKLKRKTHNYYPSIDSYCCSRHVILVEDIDDTLKEYEQC